ncbi:hypothetical protein INP83_03095 [Mucilaginibacter sp. 21P]|uniref:hypothetical protein n=1 Tax=Mucilaginibacter sp. 21P TaxID=2778902 RepID=UPI001C5A5567|nr:hypothetical protein [Mucilaginibacter sp. 21P]QXV66096.1 hypothetical protein INP83_03095 [Mucilaginibacter sp. 21P]
MAEIKYDLIDRIPTLSNKRKKRWVLALLRANNEGQAMQNRCVEAAYHKIIAIVKSSYLKPGEVYFERDWKEDSSYGIFNMHSFITPTFSWSLDCTLLYDYEISYSFGDCPSKESILETLTAYPLDRQCKMIKREDYSSFYKSVLRKQPKQFQFTS